jgi:hypothetical protein
MATKDELDPDGSLPLFLSADEPELIIGSERAVISLRFVTASILVATATAIGISILSAKTPATLFADVTASADRSAPPPATDELTPSIQSAVFQSTAEAQPSAKDAPPGEISTSESASQTQAENSKTSLEALFVEFQAWNSEQDARNLAQPAHDDASPVAENAPTSGRPMQKHRRARTTRSARAEMIRHVRERRANIRRESARLRARPIQDARAQTPSVQYAEPPSFLESLNPFGASPTQRRTN